MGCNWYPELDQRHAHWNSGEADSTTDSRPECGYRCTTCMSLWYPRWDVPLCQLAFRHITCSVHVGPSSMDGCASPPVQNCTRMPTWIWLMSNGQLRTDSDPGIVPESQECVWHRSVPLCTPSDCRMRLPLWTFSLCLEDVNWLSSGTRCP